MYELTLTLMVLYNSQIFKHQMGNHVSIDKHTTMLEDWLQVSDKLQNIDFSTTCNSHIKAWKVFADDLSPGECSILPLELDSSAHGLISSQQCYILLVIYNHLPQCTTIPSSLHALLLSVRQNIEESSYRTHLLYKQYDKCEYYSYAFMGKLAKNRLRMTALGMAYKLQKIVDSKKKMAIMSGGGVLRNKKLQKGSTLQLGGDGERDIAQFTDIHAVSIFSHQKPKFNILSFKSGKTSPFYSVSVPVSISVPVIIQTITTPPPKPMSLKPPLLKLTLKPYEQVTYDQIAEEQATGEVKFDIRATARHQLKMEKFQSECSQIIEGVYVSGEKVAKNHQILQRHNIKYIVNCAGDYCQNWHQSRGITYLTFFLKDSQTQNIECLFYRVIEFILAAQKAKTNILVHCIQGISRSVTLVIAFIIFKLGYDYKRAQKFIKDKRAIACPNNGFMVELIQFHKRLYQNYDSLPSPRVFLISSHCKETPHIITARFLKNPLFDSKKYVGLDSRGVYIIQAHDIVYTWVGSKCEDKRLQLYWSYAQDFVKKLQKYERASIKTKAISQGSQGRQFFSLWNLQQSPQLYQNPQYTRLFCQGQATKPGGMRKYYQRQPQQLISNKLFIYPDFKKPLGVFEMQDLSAGLCVLVHAEGQDLEVYLYRGDQCQKLNEQQSNEDFLDQVLKTHYQAYDLHKITIHQQSSDMPSQGFLSCFA